MNLPVTPNRELGQHFLVDENILGVAGRLAELDPGDVVLEVGAGLGVLTTFLADRVETVHAVELDRGLEPHLRERLGDRRNVELVFGDALGSRSTSSIRRRRSSSPTSRTRSPPRWWRRAWAGSPQCGSGR